MADETKIIGGDGDAGSTLTEPNGSTPKAKLSFVHNDRDNTIVITYRFGNDGEAAKYMQNVIDNKVTPDGTVSAPPGSNGLAGIEVPANTTPEQMLEILKQASAANGSPNPKIDDPKKIQEAFEKVANQARDAAGAESSLPPAPDVDPAPKAAPKPPPKRPAPPKPALDLDPDDDVILTAPAPKAKPMDAKGGKEALTPNSIAVDAKSADDGKAGFKMQFDNPSAGLEAAKKLKKAFKDSDVNVKYNKRDGTVVVQLPVNEGERDRGTELANWVLNKLGTQVKDDRGILAQDFAEMTDRAMSKSRGAAPPTRINNPQAKAQGMSGIDPVTGKPKPLTFEENNAAISKGLSNNKGKLLGGVALAAVGAVVASPIMITLGILAVAYGAYKYNKDANKERENIQSLKLKGSTSEAQGLDEKNGEEKHADNSLGAKMKRNPLMTVAVICAAVALAPAILTTVGGIVGAISLGITSGAITAAGAQTAAGVAAVAIIGGKALLSESKDTKVGQSIKDYTAKDLKDVKKDIRGR